MNTSEVSREKYLEYIRYIDQMTHIEYSVELVKEMNGK
jgi:hypothetical protein